MFKILRLVFISAIMIVAILGLLHQVSYIACMISMGILGVNCFVLMGLTYKEEE